jgi:glycosyltransferase involved in cell wall biosynthesis
MTIVPQAPVVQGLVSVVMPVWNGSEYLALAIDSLLAQSYAAWELLVVDDGSTDATPEIVRGYRDERVKYHRQENRGQAAALNAGLDRASGEFVTTLDADDWLPVESLSSRVARLVEQPSADVVYGDGTYVDAQGQPLQRFTELMPAGATGDVFDTLVVSPFYGTGATVLIRRAVLLRTGQRYDETIVWCQDWDFYIRLAADTSWAFAPEQSINYRVHDAGMTLSMPSGRRLESLIRLRRKVLEMARFARVSAEQRERFFYDVLVRDLDDRVDAQREVLGSTAFASLPSERRARMLRVVANGYLATGRQVAAARSWLGAALAANPTDPKTLLTWVLARTSPAAARKVVSRWRAKPDVPLSPFDTAARPPASGDDGAPASR